MTCRSIDLRIVILHCRNGNKIYSENSVILSYLLEIFIDFSPNFYFNHTDIFVSLTYTRYRRISSKQFFSYPPRSQVIPRVFGPVVYYIAVVEFQVSFSIT